MLTRELESYNNSIHDNVSTKEKNAARSHHRLHWHHHNKTTGQLERFQ